ncbi:MAG: site-2 protease family protein [Gammaproteobacteria bacterium]|jgi:Zn-dependent protease/CBS domain-containing protein
MRNGFRLGRIAGIEVQVDWSLLIIFFLITFSLAAGLFPAWHPDWSPGLSWLTALVAAVAFFASVLAHELSHALVGRSKGIEVRRITLFIFGGMAHMENEPRAWRAELWMAIVGPITSLVLGALFLALAGMTIDTAALDPEHPERIFATLAPLPTVLLWLGNINIILGLFNLVPGFPLDGGRVLRAVMWGITGNMRRATRWASLGGQFFAWLLIASGVAMMLGLQVPLFGTGFVPGLWLAFIGWFLNNAALVSYRQLLVRQALEDVPVTRLMQTDFSTVSPDTTVDGLIHHHLLGTEQRSFPVAEDGRLIGMVCLQDIRRIAREVWPQTTAREIMTPLDKLARVAPGDDAAAVLEVLARQQVNQLPVMEDGELRGLVRREDILRWLMVYGGEEVERLAGPLAGDDRIERR